MCEELHSSLEFLDYFGKDNNDEADDGGHIWIHEGVWEYMAGRGYMENKNIFPAQILFLEL